MRRTLLTAVLLLSAASLSASTRNHSYITYDAGDHSVVVSSDDRREIEARSNMPIFPGDEIRTGRRGRTEVRLADGNVIAIDRNSAVRFRSILDSYDGQSERTAIDMRAGSVMLRRLSSSRNAVRIDTEIASYVMARDTILSLESDGDDGDVLSVYEGSVEIRTEEGNDRVRAGEEVRIDSEGVYASNTVVEDGTTDFERWFLRRAQRYGSSSSRYLDSRFAYADSDFDSNGTWVYVSDYSSWVWRPRVSVGWRPYYHGQWRHSPGGSLVWVSDEPWGWIPYHYGRWAFSPVYGWVWLPGSGYSPAWVYWAYGPSYVGWVPAGWYDCYRPYYDWAYRPYARSGVEIAMGFSGRVRLDDVDLRGWTFVQPGTLISNRIDRTALTTDLVRNRLAREGDTAFVTGSPARFTREQLKNPDSAVGVIARGGLGGGTGRGSSGSSTADLTSFFRRDPELPASVKERLVRPRGGDRASAAPSRGTDGVARGTTPATKDDAGVIRRGTTPASGGSTGTIRRGGSSGSGETITVTPRARSGETIDRGRTEDSSVDSWRATPRVRRGKEVPAPPQTTTPAPERDGDGGTIRRREPRTESPTESWRARPRGEGDDSGSVRRRSVSRAPSADADETPRRVIDRIGGSIRVTPAERSSDKPKRERSATPRSERVERPRASSGSSSGSSTGRSSDSKSSSSKSSGKSSNIEP